jgi:acetyl-CoA acyltransferase
MSPTPEAVYIVEAVRTPIGRRDGALRDIHPVDLAAHALRTLVARTGVTASDIEDVIMGCVTQTGEQGANIARLAVLRAGFPVEVPAFSLNRMCGSSQQALHGAAQAIAAGDIDLAIAGGVESMTRVPIGSDWSPKVAPADFPYELVHQGISAEMMAQKWRLTRDELDDFSFTSHLRAAAATREGRFARELVPLPGHEDASPTAPGSARSSRRSSRMARSPPPTARRSATARRRCCWRRAGRWSAMR